MTEKDDKAQKLKEIQDRLSEIQGKSNPPPPPKSEKESKPAAEPVDSKKEEKPKPTPPSPPKEAAPVAKKVVPPEVKKEVPPKSTATASASKEKETQEEKNWKANRIKDKGSSKEQARKPKASLKENKEKKKRKVRLSFIYTIISLIITLSIVGYFIYTNYMSGDASREIQSSIPTSTISEEETNDEVTSEGSQTEEEVTDVDESEMIAEEDEPVIEEEPKQEPPVNKRTLKKTKESPKKTSTPTIQTKIPSGFIISYSVNSNTSTAETNVLKLQGRGFNAGYYYMPDKDPANKSLYRVYVGPFNTKAQAWDELSKVSKIEARAFIMEM